jgi:putative transcription factor
VQCAVCGREAKLVKIELEGAIVEVCDKCSSLGKQVAIPEYKPVKRGIKLEFKEDDKEVVPKYGKLIENARMKKGLSREEFAKALAEKESVVRRLELEEMVPDMELARKIESLLGIKLVEDYKDVKVKKEEKKKLGLTLGDIVELK